MAVLTATATAAPAGPLRRAKSRVLLTRFVAQVLLNGYYRPDALLPPKTPAGCE